MKEPKNIRKENPYKPVTVAAAVFDALDKPAAPREVCKAVAKKMRKAEEKVWQTFEVLRTPKHSGNRKRSVAVSGPMEGTVQLVSTVKDK